MPALEVSAVPTQGGTMRDLVETPNKGGRPSKFTVDRVKTILRCVGRGLPLSLASEAAGVSYAAVALWREKDPKFAEALSRAVARGADARLRKIEAAAEAGDWRAAAWLLEHCLPAHFAKTRIEVEAVGQFDHALVIPQSTLDRIAEARAKHERELNSGELQAIPVQPETNGAPF